MLPFFHACGEERPVLVGFAGQLTGPQADIGVQGRNGAALAVDEINAAGGVNGRPLELVPVDDQGTPEGARAAVSKLAEKGVVAVIGHMTSGQSVAALPLAKEKGLLLLSPTSSTTALEGKKDMFFRVQPVVSSSARALAAYLHGALGKTRVAVLYDTDNKAYSDAYLKAFRNALSDLGGTLTSEQGFSSNEKNNYLRLLAQTMDSDPQGLLLIASAYDTAIIAQTYYRGGWKVPLFFTGWSQTDKLLHMGGQAIEGCLIASHFDPHNTSPLFQNFRRAFSERFGKEPTFAAAQAHDALMLLAKALELVNLNKDKLPTALTSIKSFPGVNGQIGLDAYGDVIKKHYIITVRDGQFVTLDSELP